MSHFTVLVIGDNPETQLAPYHEFECTGKNDEYVQDVDITDELRASMAKNATLEEVLEDHGMDSRILAPGEEPDKDGDHKYGFAIVDNGKLVKAVQRTNKNAKWDWYQIGGRWTGFWKLRSGSKGEVGSPGIMTPKAEAGRADVVRKGDIDIEAMRDDAGKKAATEYDLVAQLFGGTIPTMEYLWKNLLKDDSMNITKKRDLYHNQESLTLFKNLLKENKDISEKLGYWVELDSFQVTRELYIQDARNRALSTFAFVRDGKWFERGTMGWWACVSHEMDDYKWYSEFNKMLDELPEDTILTVVDCHI